MQRIVPFVTLAAGLAAGAWFGVAYAENKAEPPAYVLVSGRVIDEEGLEAYGAAAGPPAQAAGIEILAREDADALTVVEGRWPFDGSVTVERFRSMQAFKDFWNSPAYQEAMQLRAGKVEIDFIVALEGME